MRHITFCTASFYLCMAVLFWVIGVLAGYVFDHVHSYAGPTPMALDTAICLATLSISGIALSVGGMREHVRVAPHAHR